MIDNYVCCENCEYKDYCHNFDAFSGCAEGKESNPRKDRVQTFNEELT